MMMTTTKTTQKTQILEWMQSGKRITPLDAEQHFGCRRLGARIFNLKQDGHQILSERVRVKTRRGVAYVSAYWLAN